MITDSRFIIVAGTARNVGKTTLVCRIIKQESHRNIIALKFITLKKEGVNHEHHQNISTYKIIEEKDIHLEKDTVTMLKAGARKSFLVIAQDNFIEDAIADFMSRINKKDTVVAESATLRNYIIPHKFIIVDRAESENKKAYIKDLLPLADYFIDDVLDEKQIDKIFKV